MSHSAAYLARAGLRAVAAHPVSVILTVGALALGIASITAGLSVSTAPSEATGPPPLRLHVAGQTLAPGPVSLEAADADGLFVTVEGDRGALATVARDSPVAARRLATFLAVAGLADARCFSFRAADGRYLRHAASRLRLEGDLSDPAFRRDATFCVRDGARPGSASLEAFGSPGSFVRHVDHRLGVDRSDASRSFRAASSFLVRDPLID